VKAERELPTQALHPVLDTYLNNAVAITGCHSYGIARECCEYDVIVVSNEKRSRTSVKSGAVFMDLFFMSEKEVLGPVDPELSVSLASMKPVRDNSFIFSTSSAAARAVLRENEKRSAESRLAGSLKALGRADDALSRDSVTDADFWLLSAAYEFAASWLYSAGSKPAPSHLLEQLKAHSRKSSAKFEAFSKAAGLERASRHEAAARLDALSTVFDAINTSETGESEDLGSTSTRTVFDIVRTKADFLTNAIKHVDCYSFLGFEVCSAIPLVSAAQSRAQGIEVDQARLVATLSKGEQKMVGERLIRALGLSREESVIQNGIEILREEVSHLAKNI
jgi:hypothetical protein